MKIKVDVFIWMNDSIFLTFGVIGWQDVNIDVISLLNNNIAVKKTFDVVSWLDDSVDIIVWLNDNIAAYILCYHLAG
jgi:hypothetical protein